MVSYKRLDPNNPLRPFERRRAIFEQKKQEDFCNKFFKEFLAFCENLLVWGFLLLIQLTSLDTIKHRIRTTLHKFRQNTANVNDITLGEVDHSQKDIGKNLKSD